MEALAVESLDLEEAKAAPATPASGRYYVAEDLLLRALRAGQTRASGDKPKVLPGP